jgi:hypothetical protein
MDFETRYYIPGDEKGLVELLQDTFQVWPNVDVDDSVDYWIWKHLDSPAGPSIVTVALKDNMIVGSHHNTPHNIKIGDRTISASQATDLATHPNFRRMGVNRSINEHNIEHGRDDIFFTFWVTQNPIVKKLNRSGGNFEFPRPISNLIHLENVNRYLEKKKVENKYLYQIKYSVQKFLSDLRNQPSNHVDFEIVNISNFSERIQVFWDSIKTRYDFAFVLSPEYLNWRYCDPRAGKYEVYSAEKESEILGFIVTRVNRIDIENPRGFIVELLVASGRSDVAKALLKESVNNLLAEGVNEIRSWVVEKHFLEPIFLENGFFKTRQPISTFYNFTKVEEQVTQFQSAPPQRLHFSYGSTDWV